MNCFKTIKKLYLFIRTIEMQRSNELLIKVLSLALDQNPELDPSDVAEKYYENGKTRRNTAREKDHSFAKLNIVILRLSAGSCWRDGCMSRAFGVSGLILWTGHCLEKLLAAVHI
jgi:hypothetical protein